ncbi:c-type cytochrome [Paraburkholderia fungorum]|uniref:Cytochrome C biogenesis protein CcdA n=1 Tax=Paraburkholderia fungorum TaxID=134537 RepID=A0A420GWC3_9BURK|nr:cytochrome c [Paraburkholderia fungorum]RKF49514.1 cytochrome C biogenesis protein CcdA [Paraburkholderia fungorum]
MREGRRSIHTPPRTARAALLVLLSPLALVVLSVLASCSSIAPGEQSAGAGHEIGTPLTAQDLAAWNIDVAPDGRGLPAGSGDVATGAHVFAAKCAACHGAQGEGGLGDQLIGGQGTLMSAKPKRTVGSYWPYATTLFDYIRRAMPYNAPESLSADEVYALSAFLLNRNGIVPADTRLDAASLPRVAMPNRDGFVADPRPGRL